jgi:hypothetical protein
MRYEKAVNFLEQLGLRIIGYDPGILCYWRDNLTPIDLPLEFVEKLMENQMKRVSFSDFNKRAATDIKNQLTDEEDLKIRNEIDPFCQEL